MCHVHDVLYVFMYSITLNLLYKGTTSDTQTLGSVPGGPFDSWSLYGNTGLHCPDG